MNPQQVIKKSARASKGQIVLLNPSKFDPAKLGRIRKRTKANFGAGAEVSELGILNEWVRFPSHHAGLVR